MYIKERIINFWEFLKKDTWQSWIVSIILVVIGIKFIFFPLLSFITGASLPLVVVESCSMYHESDFEDWWSKNAAWYKSKEIGKSDFESFSLKNGLNKGDIVFVWGNSDYKKGDIIIFLANSEAVAKYPIIHRIVSKNPISTKGDHNNNQLTIDNNSQKIDETNISEERIIGKAAGKIPLIGWIKLIFFNQTGFCR